MVPKSKRSSQMPPVMGSNRSILALRGHRVILDRDLAALYDVEVRVLVQAVKRNIARFPEDSMFRLAAPEWSSLRSQFGILKTGRGQHRKYQPYAFTEQGVAMLSSVLRSERAILSAIRELMHPAEPKRRPIGFIR